MYVFIIVSRFVRVIIFTNRLSKEYKQLFGTDVDR